MEPSYKVTRVETTGETFNSAITEVKMQHFDGANVQTIATLTFDEGVSQADRLFIAQRLQSVSDAYLEHLEKKKEQPNG